MDYKLSKKKAKELLESKLLHFFGVGPNDATYEHIYRALAMILTEMMNEGRTEFEQEAKRKNVKDIYYLSMEFLMGRSMKNNLYNLDLLPVFDEVLSDYGISLDRVFESEPDAGLGNGGLGRLAACYLDALATQGYAATGYSILYEYGIFKQKIVDGWQTELPDFWLSGGDAWLVKREESAVDISFEGSVKEEWYEKYHHVELVDTVKIKAVPYDMYVSGKGGKGISVLRLWSAVSPGLDMALFNEGNYMRAMENASMAQIISKVLYPADNHPEGKSLRLRQQYFLVSASIQDIVKKHLRQYPTLDNLPEKVAIHINDTHPTLAIPELMRILLDECGYGWDEAWNIVTNTTAYTNHTVMREALEVWGEELLKRLLPRIYQIIKEIDNRFRSFVWNSTQDPDLVESTAIISDSAVRMANLCVAGSHSVNGVSALHSEILKTSVFNDFYRLMPFKFKNVTNGIAHRRWLSQANPALAGFIKELIGDGFVYNGDELLMLREYQDDSSVLKELQRIKTLNKERYADYIKRKTGISINPNSIFDVQVKRLHEYKRQHLNALSILNKYLEIKDNPNGNYIPRTYIFAAKAAPGYFLAKKIISLISALSDLINNDKDANKYLKVVFVEDYSVTEAENLMPAADISEQISLAGTEASGTGNMKLMLNGAITLGTMDGANIEIFEAVGPDNIIIFGMNEAEVTQLRHLGYNPADYYFNNRELKRTIDYMNNVGVGGKSFSEISKSITNYDPYMVLADYADYRLAQKRSDELYSDSENWSRMSLMNISGAGRFAADRAIREYADNIWGSPSAFGFEIKDKSKGK